MSDEATITIKGVLTFEQKGEEERKGGGKIEDRSGRAGGGGESGGPCGRVSKGVEREKKKERSDLSVCPTRVAGLAGERGRTGLGETEHLWEKERKIRIEDGNKAFEKFT